MNRTAILLILSSFVAGAAYPSLFVLLFGIFQLSKVLLPILVVFGLLYFIIFFLNRFLEERADADFRLRIEIGRKFAKKEAL